MDGQYCESATACGLGLAVRGCAVVAVAAVRVESDASEALPVTDGLRDEAMPARAVCELVEL